MDILVYKKKLFGKEAISYVTSINYHLKLSDCAKNNGGNIYLIRVTPKATTTISIKVAQHRDEKNPISKRNAIWKPDEKTAMADTNILYQRYWYVPKESIPILYEYILNDNVYDYQQQLLSGTITVAGLASILFPGAQGAAISVLSGCVGMTIPNLKTDMLQKISKAAKFDGKNYTSGVLMYQYFYTPQALTFSDVEAWDGGTMYGPDGWTGTWTFN